MDNDTKPGRQYVCTVCGYNMVGYYPEKCPFCGSPRERFITAEECSQHFKVRGTPVTEKVTRLNSVPSLGFEHATYCVKLDRGGIWIDCPSCFDTTLFPMDCIIFTHHHFLGACNLYRKKFSTRVRINECDTANDLCRGFVFDELFRGDFTENGLEAYHIDGHTGGFTFYIFENVLLICDYIFCDQRSVRFNPYGPQKETIKGAHRMQKTLGLREIDKVCGYNYVASYPEWQEKFEQLLSDNPER